MIPPTHPTTFCLGLRPLHPRMGVRSDLGARPLPGGARLGEDGAIFLGRTPSLGGDSALELAGGDEGSGGLEGVLFFEPGGEGGGEFVGDAVGAPSEVGDVVAALGGAGEA